MRTVTALPAAGDKARSVRSMFDAIAPRYDVVNRVMTFGLDVVWRRTTVRSLGLPAGSQVLDVACGTGDFCRELSRRRMRPTGVDFSAAMLANARTGAPLVQGDALALPFADGCADGAVSGFALRNVTDLDVMVRELARVVRPLGRVALLEVAQPEIAPLRWGHAMYFGKVVPRIGGLLSDASAYRYLPESVAYLPPAGELLATMRDAGFVDVERRLLTAGVTQLITGTRA